MATTKKTTTEETTVSADDVRANLVDHMNPEEALKQAEREEADRVKEAEAAAKAAEPS